MQLSGRFCNRALEIDVNQARPQLQLPRPAITRYRKMVSARNPCRVAVIKLLTDSQLPLGLLNAAQGHPMLVELKNGETLNGHLVNCDNWMNLTLKEVVQTSPVRYLPTQRIMEDPS